MTNLSPKYTDASFSQPLTLDQKITIFEDRVLGWQLQIAETIINGDSANDQKAIPHADFATLSIVANYFEMIAQFEDGASSRGKEGEFARKGFKSVFPRLAIPDNYATSFLDTLYKKVRCGQYHDGIAKAGVVVGDFDYPIAFRESDKFVILDLKKLVPTVRAHFGGYILRLRDPKNADVRAKFEARFEL